MTRLEQLCRELVELDERRAEVMAGIAAELAEAPPSAKKSTPKRRRPVAPTTEHRKLADAALRRAGVPLPEDR